MKELFRPMRRGRQALSEEACAHLLENVHEGVLSVLGEGDYPYGVPLNHIFSEGTIYLHCALTGHKIDAIQRHPLVCYTVVERHDIMEEKFTTLYRSVIVRGKAEIITNEEDKRRVARLLTDRLCPSQSEKAKEEEIENGLPRMCVVAIHPDHITGKQGLQLLRQP